MLKEVEDKVSLEHIDKYMRSHFGMVKDGEIRVDIVEKND
jgi:cell division protein FtsB